MNNKKIIIMFWVLAMRVKEKSLKIIIIWSMKVLICERIKKKYVFFRFWEVKIIQMCFLSKKDCYVFLTSSSYYSLNLNQNHNRLFRSNVLFSENWSSGIISNCVIIIDLK